MTHETKTTALVVSHDPERKGRLADIVTNEPMDWLSCDTAEAAANVLRSETVSIVVCDEKIFSASSETILRQIRRQAPIPELIITGSPVELEALHLSSTSCGVTALPMPLTPASVRFAVNRALESHRLRRENGTLRSHVAMTYGYDNIIGESPALRTAKETAARIAPTDIATLITGPAGSGKELFARTIHHHSERRRHRFVMVDCGATPSEGIQTLLFGSNEGLGPSYCEKADGGTLLLDNVDSLDSAAQLRLLTFVKDGLVASKRSSGYRKVDVRLMAATSANLHTLVAAGEFREDLYFKLAVITLAVPSLADCTNDIPLITDYFLRRLNRELMRPDMTVTPLAMEKLMSHRWPGNVRELENTLRRAATLSADGQIDVTHVSFLSSGTESTDADQTREGRHSLVISSGLLVHHQREVIVKALDDNRWNFTKTAAALGIGRTTLWRKVKKYNLVPASGVVAEE